jgi:hypothetical protein
MESVQVPANETGPEAPAEQPQQGGAQAERPSWLPEKFKSPEEMAKSYGDLEKRLGGANQQQQQEEEAPADQQQKDQPTPDQEDVQFAQKWENQFSDFSKEYSEKGQLSDDSFKKLKEMGYPKQVVNAYIEGQKALAERGTQSLMTDIGGQDGFKEMHDWATQNLTQDEIDSYNSILDTGDQRQASFAVKGMFARYKSASGNKPKLVSGSQTRGSTQTFRSIAEMTRAMSDPRYKSDPAFRKDVERRLENSKIL